MTCLNNSRINLIQNIAIIISVDEYTKIFYKEKTKYFFGFYLMLKVKFIELSRTMTFYVL